MIHNYRLIVESIHNKLCLQVQMLLIFSANLAKLKTTTTLKKEQREYFCPKCKDSYECMSGGLAWAVDHESRCRGGIEEREEKQKGITDISSFCLP